MYKNGQFAGLLVSEARRNVGFSFGNHLIATVTPHVLDDDPIV